MLPVKDLNIFYRFPLMIDFHQMKEEIAGALQKCNRWYKREHEN